MTDNGFELNRAGCQYFCVSYWNPRALILETEPLLVHTHARNTGKGVISPMVLKASMGLTKRGSPVWTPFKKKMGPPRPVL